MQVDFYYMPTAVRLAHKFRQIYGHHIIPLHYSHRELIHRILKNDKNVNSLCIYELSPVAAAALLHEAKLQSTSATRGGLDSTLAIVGASFLMQASREKNEREIIKLYWTNEPSKSPPTLFLNAGHFLTSSCIARLYAAKHWRTELYALGRSIQVTNYEEILHNAKRIIVHSSELPTIVFILPSGFSDEMDRTIKELPESKQNAIQAEHQLIQWYSSMTLGRFPSELFKETNDDGLTTTKIGFNNEPGYAKLKKGLPGSLLLTHRNYFEDSESYDVLRNFCWDWRRFVSDEADYFERTFKFHVPDGFNQPIGMIELGVLFTRSLIEHESILQRENSSFIQTITNPLKIRYFEPVINGGVEYRSDLLKSLFKVYSHLISHRSKEIEDIRQCFDASKLNGQNRINIDSEHRRMVTDLKNKLNTMTTEMRSWLNEIGETRKMDSSRFRSICNELMRLGSAFDDEIMSYRKYVHQVMGMCDARVSYSELEAKQ